MINNIASFFPCSSQASRVRAKRPGPVHQRHHIADRRAGGLQNEHHSLGRPPGGKARQAGSFLSALPATLGVAVLAQA